jgi:arginyl-tRNA synthetase
MQKTGEFRMDEIKKYIAEEINKVLTNKYNFEMSLDEIVSTLEKPKDDNMGDIALPCFKFAKLFRNSPVNIAKEICDNLILDDRISKKEIVSGYINFYTNSEKLSESILENIIHKGNDYGFVNVGKGQNVTIDYSSPNIAKPFHLGHFRTTIIGRTLYNLYNELGYNSIGINHLGDWGRQFGLLIVGYERFKDEYDIEKDPLHTLTDLYVRINKLAKDDESIFDKARDNFKKLEYGDKELLALWQYFKDVSMKEYERIYKILGCKFDSYNGEAFYNDKMDEVVKILDEKGVLIESEGAKVVKLGDNEPPCIILKSNGSTIYATRDLAAVLYRSRTYDYVKSIYVTSYEQIHHFKQVFEVAKYLVDEKYTKELVHVPYGMVRLKTGKMSTREGTVIYLQDLIEEAIAKAKKIIEEKGAEVEDIDLLAKQIGIGALVFNDLKHNKIKDIVFDLDEVLRFDGETGPYVQYTYVRICSLMNKAGIDVSAIKKINYKFNEDEVKLIKLLDKFEGVIYDAAESYEPSILARYIIDVASSFSVFYNNNSILVEDTSVKEARLLLANSSGIVIKKGLNLLGIETPTKM